MTDINPKIIEKFKKLNLPERYMKFIIKLLDSEYTLSRISSSEKNIISSYSHILTEFAEDKDILDYIKSKKGYL